MEHAERSLNLAKSHEMTGISKTTPIDIDIVMSVETYESSVIRLVTSSLT